jgi:hypothetical protein
MSDNMQVVCKNSWLRSQNLIEERRSKLTNPRQHTNVKQLDDA